MSCLLFSCSRGSVFFDFSKLAANRAASANRILGETTRANLPAPASLSNDHGKLTPLIFHLHLHGTNGTFDGNLKQAIVEPAADSRQIP
jgi:hypothetical protein